MKKIDKRKYIKFVKNEKGLYVKSNAHLIFINEGFKIFFKVILFIIIAIVAILSFYFLFKVTLKKKYNYVNVAYSIDKNYYLITHVSMKSIMLSQNQTTFINFFILCSNLTSENKEIIDKISLQHKNCKIQYFDMKNKFKDFRIPASTVADWTTANFYRVLLPNLLPNEKKILYLDGDTLVYKDLNKIYNYNIDNKYYVGMLELKNLNFDYFPEKFDNYINTGVILCNLEELRKGNISQKFIEFYKAHESEIRYPVNDVLNIVTHEKNGFFGPEYVMATFCDEEEAFNYYKNKKDMIDKEAYKEAYNDPYIYHYIPFIKPWKGIHKKNGEVCVDNFIRFYEMARKTDYYKEILKKFKVK